MASPASNGNAGRHDLSRMTLPLTIVISAIVFGGGIVWQLRGMTSKWELQGQSIEWQLRDQSKKIDSLEVKVIGLEQKLNGFAMVDDRIRLFTERLQLRNPTLDVPEIK